MADETEQTPLKNDPIYLDSFIIEGDLGFVNCTSVKSFSPSCDSFLPLVHADYYNLISANRPFGKTVSLSSYVYYNIMHLWARFFAIMQYRGQLTFAEKQFAELFEHAQLPVTEPVNRYLCCIGDFEDTCGIPHHLKVTRPNKDGDFGRIGKDTHNLYESLPAPRIALERVRQDIIYSTHMSQTPIWEIVSLRPNEACAGERPSTSRSESTRVADRFQIHQDSTHTLPPIPGVSEQIQTEDTQEESEDTKSRNRNMPTVNLLGWFPAEKLSTNQLFPLQHLVACGDFLLDHNQMCYCADLMHYVAINMHGLTNYKTALALHESKMGSRAQEGFLDIMMVSSFNRCNYYSDGQSRVCCSSRLDEVLANGMSIMGLGIKKNEINEVHPWACYDFVNYTEVPLSWICNRNDIFIKGLELRVHAPFHSAIRDREQRRLNFLRQAILKSNHV